MPGRYGAAAAAVIDKGIDSFLEHPFFVPDDDVRSLQFLKAFQTIVTVDDTAIEVVQVACSKTAAIELNHRTQIRRNDRNDIHDHPFWLVAALEEGFTDIETAHDVAFFLEARLRLECCPQFLRQFFHIDFVEQFLDGFGTNADAESIPEFIQFFLVFGFCEELLFVRFVSPGSRTM